MASKPKTNPALEAMQIQSMMEQSALSKEQMALIRRQQAGIDEAKAQADREKAEQKVYKQMGEDAASAGRVGSRSLLSNGWAGFLRTTVTPPPPRRSDPLPGPA